MIGPGIIGQILNILPVAYAFISPFSGGRGSLMNTSYHGRRDYYRKTWMKFFFGRHTTLTVPAILIVFIQSHRYQIKQGNLFAYRFFAPISELTSDDYDDEIESSARDALQNYQKQRALAKNTENYSKSRAEDNYRKKTESFEQALANYNSV
mmetsp:Transcript_13802/g.14358  ORF Transcript_13802/g.14358 Transcript_13802/m.14358 type:complete len:152 (+) Transcript_13802:35-490(+)